MPVFLVNYDINSPNTGLRKKLLESITELDSVKFSESSYAVACAGDAKTLWESLSVYVDKNDTLLVLRLTPDCYGQADDEAVMWFNKAKELGCF